MQFAATHLVLSGTACLRGKMKVLTATNPRTTGSVETKLAACQGAANLPLSTPLPHFDFIPS